jgi:LysR family glycine cleavage system transcriptional activator
MHKSARPLPPLDLVRGFEAAARHLSFTRAAEELFVTQSAVSRQVQALEGFLGVALFERRHRALALTEAGQAYYRAAESALAQLRAATQLAREAERGHVLTVTTTVSFASIWLVPRLAQFRRAHPGVDVRIAATHEVVDLAREGIDVAIRDIPSGREPPGAVPLAGERLCPVASPAYLREARAPLARPADLRHHVMLQLHDPQGRWPWLTWAAWLEANGLAGLVPAGTLTYGQYDQVVNAALHGQGVALGRLTVVDSLVGEGRLVALFGRNLRVARAMHAVYAPGAQARPEARAFVEWLREEIGAGRHEPAARPRSARRGKPG